MLDFVKTCYSGYRTDLGMTDWDVTQKKLFLSVIFALFERFT